MSLHDYSVFANLCMKTPINPRSKLPKPSYLKPQCKFDMEKPQIKRVQNKKKRRKKCQKFCSSPSPTEENSDFTSLVKFYNSIPDYTEISELSEIEFNIKLDTLRKKQLELGFRALCISDDFTNQTNIPENLDPIICIHANPEKPAARKGSAKSVRISSEESMRSPVPFLSEREDKTSKYFRGTLRRKSPSPERYSSKMQLTVPEPFLMTQREETERSLENIFFASTVDGIQSPILYREKSFKANPVPITSKFPMYKEILKDQEHKSQLAKLESAIQLESKIEPFSFDTHSPRKFNSRCLTRSNSSPNLYRSDFQPQSNNFKARPCPKNLFSNYFYHKMCEDDHFRAMNKKIRSEEMLKRSNLPPSMAKREASRVSSSNKSSKKRRKKIKKLQDTGKVKQISPSNDARNFITTCPHPFELQTEKRGKARTCNHSSPTTETSSRTSRNRTSSSTESYYPHSSMPDIPRPNLASTFRKESCRKKIDKMKTKHQDEIKLANFHRQKWDVQKMASWKALSYDPTHSEDLSLRLSTRRAEQRMRQEEYDISMEIMKQRVKSAPLLLEGQTFYGPRRVSHKCFDDTPTEEGRKSKSSRPCSSFSKRQNSKLSDYTVESDDKEIDDAICDLDSVDREFL